MSDSCCGEPFHSPKVTEKAHKKHHWRERLICLSFCTACHVVYEAFMFFAVNHHH